MLINAAAVIVVSDLCSISWVILVLALAFISSVITEISEIVKKVDFQKASQTSVLND